MSDDIQQSFQVVSRKELDTRNIAKKISSLFHEGDLIILDGDLGAGKTHFVKGFAEGLHSQDLVTSPTFSLANFYRSSSSPLLHIDLYRIDSETELNDLGLYEYFDQSITIIEWGKKFSNCFDSYVLITFQLIDHEIRQISFSAKGVLCWEKVEKIKQELAEE
ncbi:tRNA (adenosine(37)-N6)-threonylcarbamoyltransferase complex ATPase subunit type 1 TsaE [Porphyromonas loveana]|uniref:tRNA (adenosine(37)-N6)-threonylcarbamoyltransferase complex ATPase subunit type 1 TsaE n=1 Tax=Porphyromonas loveana TaxID=1884669 RepID=UPI0035A0F5B5